jgi:hypothetical protein
MEITEFVFKLLLLFFPGIICAYLVDQLTTHRPRDPFFFLLQSFVFGLVSYFLYWAGAIIASHFFSTLVKPNIAFLRSLTNSKAVFSFREIAYVSIISTILACVVSVVSRFKLLNRIAKWIGLTKKFGELDVWGYLLNMKEVAWVTVRDHDNDLIYDGWVQAFSDDSKEAELLLRDVSVYKNKTGMPLYQIGALYLSRNRENITIECRTLPIDEQVKWKENADDKTTGTPITAAATKTTK